MNQVDDKVNYFQWLKKNEPEVKEYLSNNGYDLSILGLSGDDYDVLVMNNLLDITDVVFLSADKLACLEESSYAIANSIRGKSLNFLKGLKEELVSAVESKSEQLIEPDEASSGEGNVKQMLENSDSRQLYEAYLEKHIILLETLNLSQRTYNALRRAKIASLSDALKYYPNGFRRLNNVGVKSVDEINTKIEEHAQLFFEDKLTESSPNELNHVQSFDTEMIPQDVFEAFSHDKYKELVMEYFKNINMPIESLGMSDRVTNKLRSNGITQFAEMLTLFPDKILKIKGLGALATDEMTKVFNENLNRYDKSVMAYIDGDLDRAFDGGYIRNRVNSLYLNYAPFYGISLSEFKEGLPGVVSEEKLKRCVGSMIADGILEYVDYRCYKLYPSFFTLLSNMEEAGPGSSCLMMRERCSGKTLEEIGKMYGVTRERVRQKLVELVKDIRKQAMTRYETELFDEDFFQYLFETYEISKEYWLKYINDSEPTYVYLCLAYKKGKEPVELALDDEKVNVSLKTKILDLLDKDKITIDGVKILARRGAVEDFIIKKFCKEEIRFDDFCKLYNKILMDNNIPKSEKIYISGFTKITREYKVAQSDKVLWKQGKTFRYYYIEENDYQELLDTIGIAEYSNTGVSTLLWINNYPEIMRKYDIRDQYELHNLLKKIIPEGSYNNIRFDRMPGISFGEYDRDKMIYELMVKNAPISTSELADILYEEYGYDKGTSIATYCQCISKYLVNGVYDIDFKQIPEERTNEFGSALTEDYYFDNEVKDIYLSLYPGSDTDVINKRSMREIGFNAFSNYYLRDAWPSAKDYFRHLLSKEDMFDNLPYKQRYTYNQMYWMTLREMRASFDLLTFKDDMLINLSALTKYNIDKKKIRDFCDNVDLYADDNSYFTLKSLMNDGFRDLLIESHMDKSFYEDALIASGYFSSTHCAGTVVFYKGDTEKQFTKVDFIVFVIEQYSSISVSELSTLLDEEYGIKLSEFYNVINIIDDTDCYYDQTVRTFYKKDIL